MESSAASRMQVIAGIHQQVLERLPGTHQSPVLGVICGSGLGRIGELLQDPVRIPFDEIDGFPRSTVAGHGNAIVVGRLGGVLAMVFLGRFHTYQGYDAHTTALPVRLLARMGVRHLIITNAAGSLDAAKTRVGDIMVIEDHFSVASMAGLNPLRGENLDDFGPRFPSVNEVYHPRAHEWALEVARAASIPETIIKRGIYCAALGPSFETPCEVRFLRSVGGSAVGMSTVPEVILAAQSQIRVVGLSLITNEPAEVGQPGPSHDEVLAVANARTLEMVRLVEGIAPLFVSDT